MAMPENPNPSPLSETDKLAATLAELERERQKRVDAGQWSKGERPMLVVLPEDGETLEAAQQREVYRYLADHPDAPKTIAAYDWIQYVIVDPAPTVELHPYAPDHIAAVDVTPYRPPPSPPPSSARSPAPGAGALSADPRNVNIPRDVSAAERRRTQRFQDDEWGSPQDHPLRYPRGNRNGW